MAKRRTTPTDPTRPDPGEMTYEAAVDELASIIDEIESGDSGLEASIAAYERGSALIRRCRALLDAAEQRVRELDAEGESAPSDG